MMTKREIATAIKDQRLPIGFAAYMIIMAATILVPAIAGNYNGKFSIYIYGIALVIVPFLGYFIFAVGNDLTAYPNDESLVRKKRILEELQIATNATYVSNSPNYCDFIVRSGWNGDYYFVKIIYTDQAFYLNTNRSRKNRSLFSSDGIDRIRMIEDALGK